ncbi:MAG: hypothetical protein KGJ07_08590, partial [Patescibacteria group bacterium]|nr:hypothetical protein [Patescibacteria group bacterium]
MDLQTPIAVAGRAMKMYASRLEKLGIFKLGDFLQHIPSRYEDLSLITPIDKIQPGELVTVQGTLVKIRNVFTKRGKKLQEATVEDETGQLDIIWFNQPYITKVLIAGNRVSFSGRVEKNGTHILLTAPEYELLNNGPLLHTGRLVPIYPETKGISSKWLRRQIYKIIFEQGDSLSEYLPDAILNTQKLMRYKQALEQVHFPSTLEQAERARTRLAFDEVFLLQLASSQRRLLWKQKTMGNAFDIKTNEKEIQVFWEHLPFELTGAQRKVIHAIFEDMEKSRP